MGNITINFIIFKLYRYIFFLGPVSHLDFEVFDKYDGKADIVDTTDFENFTHRNIRNFIVRDRNHPSVFLWSVGNEIGDVQWNINNGFHKLASTNRSNPQFVTGKS